MFPYLPLRASLSLSLAALCISAPSHGLDDLASWWTTCLGSLSGSSSSAMASSGSLGSSWLLFVVVVGVGVVRVHHPGLPFQGFQARSVFPRNRSSQPMAIRI